MYVREARRMRGRRVLTENDFAVADGGLRHGIRRQYLFTDWYMDSHSCSYDGTYGSEHACRPDAPYDGKLILTNRFRPAMIPYQAMLPNEFDNVIVSLCVSTTHVAWGSVRLEPCLIHLGEVAGQAAALAKQQGEQVGTIAVSHLQRRLLDSGASIAFLNDSEGLLSLPDRGHWELRVCHGEWSEFAVTDTVADR